MPPPAPDSDPAAYEEQVKKNVRSVLLPNKRGLMIEAFKRDYKEMLGTTIQCRRLGFPSLEDLLASMEDVVKMQKLSDGQIHLKGIPDKDTAHVHNLVQRQGDSGSRDSREVKQAMRNQNRREYEQMRRNRLHTRVASPQIIGEVLLVLRSNRTGLSLKDFEASYFSRFGRRLPTQQFGFFSTEDLLYSLHDSVSVCKVGREQIFVKASEKYIQVWQEEEKQQDEQKRRVVPTVRPVKPGPEDTSSGSCSDQQVPGARSQPLPNTAASFLASRPPPRGATAAAKDQDQDEDQDDIIVHKRLRENLQALVADFPDGLSVYHIAKEYKKKFGHEFDFGNYGCGSINEFCLGMCGEIFQTRKPSPKSEYYAYPHVDQQARKESGRHMKKLGSEAVSVSRRGSSPSVPTEVLEGIHKALRANNKRIRLDVFNKEYVLQMRKALNCSKYGFNNLEEMLRAMSFLKVESEVGRHGGAVKVVVLLGQDVDFEESASRPSPGASLWQDDFVMAESDYIRQQPIPEKIEIDETLEVILGEVINVGNFWIMLSDKHDDLEKLMDKLADFYCNEDLSFSTKMSACQALEGRYCAAPYGRKRDWHRAKITKILSVESAQVFYFDYGTMKAVDVKDLRFLRRDFASLPAQAINARCASICPPNRETRWSAKANERFFKLVGQDVPLVAFFRGMRRDMNSNFQTVKLSLRLVDTNTNDIPSGIDFGQTLVDEGLAEKDPNAQQNDRFQTDRTRPVENLRLEPGAEMIRMRLPMRSPLPTASVQPQLQQPTPPVFSGAHAPSPLSVPLNPSELPSFMLAPIAPPQEMTPVVPSLIRGPTLAAPSPMYVPSASSVLFTGPSVLQQQHQQYQQQQQQFLAPQDSRLNAGATPFQPPGLAQQDQASKESSVVVFPSGVNLLHRVTLDATGEGDCTAPVVVHVINAGGRAFLVSAEISRLFPRWKKRDLLGRMVALKKEVYETVVVNPNDHEDLFAEALEENVPGFVDEQGVLMESVTLYMLSDLPSILCTMTKDPNMALAEAAHALAKRFDPSDPHWRIKWG